jgi:hypothetical protein
MASMYEFPYATLEAAISDKFAKIGGPAKAYQALKQGYYNTEYRSERNKRMNALLKAAKADKRFADLVSERSASKRSA